MSEQIKSKLQLRIEELEQYLKDIDEALEECKQHPERLQLSPISGMLERSELVSLKKIWDNCEKE